MATFSLGRVYGRFRHWLRPTDRATRSSRRSSRPLAVESLESRELLTANLVTNGGFEAGSFAGWTVDSPDQYTSVSVNQPHSGLFSAELGAIDTDATLSQTLATTAGRQYVLDFFEAVNTGGPGDQQFENRFAVLLNGSPALDLPHEADHGYVEHTIPFVATGPTVLQFLCHNNPSFDYLDDVSVAEPVQINYLSTTTFITTDTITLRAAIATPTPGAQVTWTVQGQGAADGIDGFPTDYVTTTDGTGTATFSFTPSDNAALVSDRHTTWTTGSRDPNPAIRFEVTARYVFNGAEFVSRLSDTDLGPLEQDETDRLRQEYYDYDIPVPARSEVVPSLGEGYNRGNYGVQLSVDLPGHYDGVLAAYRGRQVTVTIDGEDYDTSIPDDATITISSGYRNPQRNKAVGSQHPDSRPTRGRALDLVPDPVQVVVLVDGQPRTVALPLHEALYPALWEAASTQGTAIAEHNWMQVEVGDPSENHIHVQW